MVNPMKEFSIRGVNDLVVLIKSIRSFDFPVFMVNGTKKSMPQYHY